MLDTIKRFLAIEPMHERDVAIATPFDEFPPLATQIANIRTYTVTHPRVSIAEAIGVPAIQRAVILISHTVGSLTMEGWRNGAPMPETPIVLARPDPYQTAVDWYSSVGWGMAVYGEAIGYVARRDGAGFPIALIDVPPVELTVEPNSRNRLRPIYKWGTITGTRYSTADPTGDFVHITYHRDSTSLRGVGPLQMCGVAVSVAVEAQNWAAGFFAGGGVPPLIIKSAVELDGSTDDSGLSEAQKLKAAWMAGDNNVPKVIDPGIDEVQQLDFNPQGAQLLDARQANNGDAARMFGIPGTLLEFSMPGSSLTYQNVADVWVQFLRGCLQPSYLEKIEAHMSDLLPRSQAARFNTKNLLRADIKTRYDVYTAGIAAGVISVEQAQAEEGFIPGDIERMPVAPSPPAAVPTDIANSDTLQSRSQPVRCDGRRVIRGVLTRCNTLLAEHGPFVGTCRKCKKEFLAIAA